MSGRTRPRFQSHVNLAPSLPMPRTERLPALYSKVVRCTQAQTGGLLTQILSLGPFPFTYTSLLGHPIDWGKLGLLNSFQPGLFVVG